MQAKWQENIFYYFILYYFILYYTLYRAKFNYKHTAYPIASTDVTVEFLELFHCIKLSGFNSNMYGSVTNLQCMVLVHYVKE